MISAYTLFSGSRGNSLYIKSSKTEILIDAGKSCGAIEKSLSYLGTSLKNISAIFITHEHADHTGGLEIISKKYQIPVYMTAPSYDNHVRIGSYLKRFAKRMDVEFSVTVGAISVSSFPIPHDSAQNVGYIISDGEDIFGIATDIGHLTEAVGEHLCSCKRVIVESNHDVKMVKNGPYPQHLKNRILSQNGHLSNDKCAELCAYLCDHGVEEITLAHLSQENNLPKLAYETVKNQLCACGFESIPLKIAFADITVCATDGNSYPYPINEIARSEK